MFMILFDNDDVKFMHVDSRQNKRSWYRVVVGQGLTQDPV